jgi:hypothetical protein
MDAEQSKTQKKKTAQHIATLKLRKPHLIPLFNAVVITSALSWFLFSFYAR